ncbi:MAG TPA: hypothetical protein PK274_10775 [Candidatus Fermentibacter daniensis]|nr:hypothetical protein [Candidatus Fermentibacter daniensis]
MPEIDLRVIGDTIILHLRKEHCVINAYAFATALVALADAAKNANNQINPGYEIEVLVET